MNRTQPIRKPKNHLKYELNQHRRLARAINSRIFQKRGKLYLVSRAPALATLEVPFAKLTLKSFVDDEMLSEIAFAGTCDGQLVAQMSPRERRLIRQTIATWQRHGGEKYKLHLPFNEGWIRKARKKNVKLQRWLCPTPYSMFLDNHLVTHFARFARRIARESNIQLPTDDPAPTVENLGGHFWYDDGIHPWHAAIREA